MNRLQNKYLEQSMNVLAMLTKAAEWHQVTMEGTAVTEEVAQIASELKDLMRDYEPREVNRSTWPSDVKYYFTLVDSFVELGRMDGLRDLALAWWGVFHPTYKRLCGYMRSRCTSEDCLYRFPNHSVTICPECNTPRSVCQSPSASADGRCLPHSVAVGSNGRTSAAVYKGRAEAYKMAMIPSLQSGYDEIMRDTAYLSLIGEIGLIGSRNARLLQDMDHFDPIAVKSKIDRLVVDMENALTNIESGKNVVAETAVALSAAQKIRYILGDVDRQDRRWAEIKENSRTLAALVGEERKLLVDLQQMVTKEELDMLNTQVVAAITVSAQRTGSNVEDSLIRAMAHRLDGDNFRAFKDAVSSVQVAAKVKRLILDTIEEQLRRGDQRNAIQEEYDQYVELDTIEGEVL